MIYVASSWRNEGHGEVVRALRQAGLDVYDFKEPTTCFKWTDVSDVDEHGGNLSVQAYWRALVHPTAQAGFNQDYGALQASSTVILALPAGPSAHAEWGYAVGAGKPNAIYFTEPQVRDMDLMHLMTSDFYSQLDLLVSWALRQENKESPYDEIITAPKAPTTMDD